MSPRDPYRYFRVEARDLTGQLGQGAATLLRGGGGSDPVTRLLRLAHTLKGAARVVGLGDIADKAHAIEDLLDPFRSGETAVPRETVDRVLQLVDAVSSRVETLDATPGTAPAATESAATAPDAPGDAGIAQADAEDVDAVLEGLGEAHGQLAALGRAEADIALLHRLAGALREQLGPARPGVVALVEQVRQLSASLERDVAAGLERAERELRAAREAAEQLRLIPAAALFPTLERTARDAARTLGRRIEIACSGGDVRLAAEVSRPLLDALIQLVRNAVAHGIEPPAERQSRGKQVDGRLTLDVASRGGRIVVRCADDGRGIDEEALRRTAAAQGRLPAEATGASSVMGMLLAGGVSTSERVTHVAGRGIGMDIVRDSVQRLHARISVDTAKGRGTTFELSLPLSLALVDALYVEAGGETVTVPLEAILHTRRVAPGDLERTSDGDVLVEAGRTIPFVTMARLLWQQDARPQEAVTALALRVGLALGVDRVVGMAPVVMRALPALAAAAPSVSGVSLDPAGRAVPMLDPEGAVAVMRAVGPGMAPVAGPRRRLLVVDDSLTTRMLEQSILEAAGYEVDVATSGEEGLERAQTGGYALILCDVEMPGMDGFALSRRCGAISFSARPRPSSSPPAMRRRTSCGERPPVRRATWSRASSISPTCSSASNGWWPEPMPIRVLIADDSPTVRERLRDAVEGDAGFAVVGTAVSGREAVELCTALRPDVVSMDMMMPVMTGLAATEYIMAYCPTPILVVSSSFNRGEVFRMYDALAAGAVDVLEKPGADEAGPSWDRRYLALLRLVSRIRVITHLRGRSGTDGPSRVLLPPLPTQVADHPQAPRVVALGASTGGPAAIVEVLRALSGVEIPVPVLVTLHINPQFAVSLADWLDAQTPLRVEIGEEGTPLVHLAGRVVLAPPDRHMTVAGGRLRLSDAPPRHSCRPSIDTLFESVAVEYGPSAVAALLTGMGRDGASGLLAVHAAGGATIAQDEATSIVYGMPREAVLLGGAGRVLPLGEIGPAIAGHMHAGGPIR